MFLRTKAWIAATLIVIAALIVVVRAYCVQYQFHGSLVWNDDVAYIFIGEGIDGWDLSYLGSGLALIEAVFPFGGPAPTDRHGSTLVLRLTANSVQSFAIGHFAFGDIDPLEGTLFAPNMLPGGHMMKWCGDHFEPATATETQNLFRYVASLPKGPPLSINFDNVQGWSRRIVVGDVVNEVKDGRLSPIEKDSHVTIEIDGQQLTFAMNSGFISKQAYIDLIRPGRPTERIWQLDERFHRVSSAE